MTAFFLAPIYIIVNIYIFMRITGWLKTGFPVLGTRRGIVLSAAVYSFFAVSFLTAFLMPEGTVQRSMKLLGNYCRAISPVENAKRSRQINHPLCGCASKVIPKKAPFLLQ